MTKFEHPSFSVAMGGKAYTDNWDRIFGKKDNKCLFGEEDCQREVDPDKESEEQWCNFHIAVQARSEAPQETDDDTTDVSEEEPST